MPLCRVFNERSADVTKVWALDEDVVNRLGRTATQFTRIIALCRDIECNMATGTNQELHARGCMRRRAVVEIGGDGSIAGSKAESELCDERLIPEHRLVQSSRSGACPCIWCVSHANDVWDILWHVGRRGWNKGRENAYVSLLRCFIRFLVQ